MLKEFLKSQKMSQEALAKKAGLSLLTVHDLVNNKSKDIKISTLIKLSRATEITVSELVNYYGGNNVGES